MTGPLAALLPDGKRLHLQHGPIDLIIEAFGAANEVRRAYDQAANRFPTILDELVGELPALRRPLGLPAADFDGPVARRMATAVQHHGNVFVTPMAAVAGAVADEILSHMTEGRRLTRAYVNNGGDIALFLAPGESISVGLVPVPAAPKLIGKATVRSGDPVRGVATSGRHGRSLSLGIADAVTVLARDAAAADAAATLIANAVDLPGHDAITREPASDRDPDSDLGDRPVVAEVGPLDGSEVVSALRSGASIADRMRAAGLIEAAALCLDGRTVVSGNIAIEAAPVVDYSTTQVRPL